MGRTAVADELVALISGNHRLALMLRGTNPPLKHRFYAAPARLGPRHCSRPGCPAPNITGIAAFDRLVDQVVRSGPYTSARTRVSGVELGSSHRSRASVERLQRR